MFTLLDVYTDFAATMYTAYLAGLCHHGSLGLVAVNCLRLDFFVGALFTHWYPGVKIITSRYYPSPANNIYHNYGNLTQWVQQHLA